MKSKKNFLSAVILSLLLLLTNVSAVPALPSFFYGSLTINSEEAPVGTEIIAKMDGEERGSIVTSESGKYGKASGKSKLLVEGENADNGKTIVFFINGVEAEQTGIWNSGEIFNLDLSVEISANNNDQQNNQDNQNNSNNDQDEEDDEEEDEDDDSNDNNQPIVNLGNIEEDINNDDNSDSRNENNEEASEDKEEQENKIFGILPMIGLLSISILVLLLAGVFVIRKTFF